MGVAPLRSRPGQRFCLCGKCGRVSSWCLRSEVEAALPTEREREIPRTPAQQMDLELVRSILPRPPHVQPRDWDELLLVEAPSVLGLASSAANVLDTASASMSNCLILELPHLRNLVTLPVCRTPLLALQLLTRLCRIRHRSLRFQMLMESTLKQDCLVRHLCLRPFILLRPSLLPSSPQVGHPVRVSQSCWIFCCIRGAQFSKCREAASLGCPVASAQAHTPEGPMSA